jgi:hypothetical protein
MKIWIFWSESNSWIYFSYSSKKLKTFTGPNKVLLVLGRRTGAHRELSVLLVDFCFIPGYHYRNLIQRRWSSLQKRHHHHHHLIIKKIIICSRNDISENLFIWNWTTITHPFEYFFELVYSAVCLKGG